jgi:hypothetical protein
VICKFCGFLAQVKAVTLEAGADGVEYLGDVKPVGLLLMRVRSRSSPTSLIVQHHIGHLRRRALALLRDDGFLSDKGGRIRIVAL